MFFHAYFIFALVSLLSSARNLEAAEIKSLESQIAPPSEWTLHGGTDSCPRLLFIQKAPDCEGFEVLNPQRPESFNERFCNLNKEALVDVKKEPGNSHQNRVRETQVKTTYSNAILIRIETKKNKMDNQILSTEKIETRLTFQKEGLMLDRQLHPQGWSCIYKRKK